MGKIKERKSKEDKKRESREDKRKKSGEDGENFSVALPSLRTQSKVKFNWIPSQFYE